MTGTEAAMAAEADKFQANCKPVKELQIKEKYEVKLVTLSIKYFSLSQNPYYYLN